MFHGTCSRGGSWREAKVTALSLPLGVAGILLGFCVPLPVLGQDADGSGSNRVASSRSDYVTKSGETVPRPDKLDLGPGRDIQRRTPEQERDDAVTRGICAGCLR
ncbi:hypothetical protein SAMN02799636_05192 [Methylobacterium sp. 275MFSha3.1]|uniref:hypothetical protein n=1 Tax=Methylobacterium sp. 275MFSha3.1 TaxID=1502746 RepID=UPI0008A742D2|nr:hypothetical protein [Methylobacterium sp. 275MFSha3.1]SEI05474.1 hypothetical protein SAMN02799636_05192 [Methylobacterium sp. 275MFSha3.1]